MAEPAASAAAPAASGAAIALRDLTKRYPGAAAPAVDGITLDIAAGETVILVGPSGCGKSTTLRMVNRLIEPTSGRIRVGNEDVTGMDPVALRRRIGYAIQSSGLFPHMTVGENVAQVPRMLRWRRARVAARVDEMLHLVGLDPAEFRDRHPRQLSGGQQQRVGVARALAADPPVLLMDEPFGALDPVTRARLQDELLRLQAELRKTIVFVTHDFDEAVRLGDRIAVLRERSRIAQFDTPQAILTGPADAFVAGFVGAGATLKRLGLTRLRDIPLDPSGGPVSDAPRQGTGTGWTDAAGTRHPAGAVGREPHGTAGGTGWGGTGLYATGWGGTGRYGGSGTRLTWDASLRDALEAVLTDPGGRVAVTDPAGQPAGVLDLAGLMRAVRALPARDRAGARPAGDAP